MFLALHGYHRKLCRLRNASITRLTNTHGLAQQLGDLLGKGAFGQVYSMLPFLRQIRSYSSTSLIGALNWTTGETVAVKQIQLANIPKSELGEIMARTNIYATVLCEAYFPSWSLERDRSIEKSQRLPPIYNLNFLKLMRSITHSMRIS